MTTEQERFNKWVFEKVVAYIVEGAYNSSVSVDELVQFAREVNERDGFTFDGPPDAWFKDPSLLTHTEREGWTRREGLTLPETELARAIERARTEWQKLTKGQGELS